LDLQKNGGDTEHLFRREEKVSLILAEDIFLPDRTESPTGCGEKSDSGCDRTPDQTNAANWYPC
jgi:hypothetical protein